MTNSPETSEQSSATAPDSVTRADLPLLGMHCAACANRIEKTLNKTPGVRECSVNFATTRATVQYDPATITPEKLREAVQNAGYDAILPDEKPAGDNSAAPTEAAESQQDSETQARQAEYS